MSTLDEVMRAVVDEVDGALGCAVVDLGTGRLLGVAHDVASFDQAYLDAVAAASVQMFRSPTVTDVEDLIAQRRGVPREHLIDEVQMTTRRTVHFMMVLPNHPDAVVVLITDRRTSTGMGWAAARRSVLEIEPLLDAAGPTAREVPR